MPASQDRSDSTSPSEAEACRVLVVEDEYLIAEDLAHALEHLGAEVIGPFARVADALPIARQSDEIDLAVLDVDIDGTSIIPVAKALRARGLPFVFATAFDPAVIPDDFRDAPCWQKPFDSRALARTLVTYGQCCPSLRRRRP